MPTTRRAPVPGRLVPYRGRRALGPSLGLLALVVLVAALAGVPRISGSSAGAIGTAAATGANDGYSPPPESYGSMAYDAADGYVLMFGGLDYTQTPHAWTYTFQDLNWSNRTPTLSVVPSPRYGAAMAYDAADRETILFGGCPDSACQPAYGDTWAYDSGSWKDLTPTLNLSPPARAEASMTYDAGDGQVLLFGGYPTGGAVGAFDDLWAFAGGHWTELSADVESGGGPSARFDAMLAYDPVRNETILFAGGIPGTTPADDTWSYHNGSWAALAAGTMGTPAPRRAAVFTWDAADSYLLLVGGYDDGTYRSDVWAFGATGWAPLAPTGPLPQGAFAAESAYDPGDGVVLIFSGAVSDGTATPTFTYAHGNFVRLLNPAGTPLDLTGLFGPLLLLPILLALVFGTAAAVQTYRDRKYGPGFPLSPSEPIRWVPSGSGRQYYTLVLLPVILVAVLIVPFVALAASASNSAAVAILLAIVLVPVLLILVAVGWLNARRTVLRRVGVAAPGVIFQMTRSERRVTWDRLEPVGPAPRRGMFVFRYLVSWGGGTQAIVVSLDQAKAILDHPGAAAMVVSPLAASALGRSPSAPKAPGIPAPRPATAPLPSSPAASAPSYSPPPPPPYPPPPPPPPPPPTPTVPQAICPGCGLHFPRYEYVFCPNCGRRMG